MNSIKTYLLTLSVFSLSFCACHSDNTAPGPLQGQALFTLLPPADTHIDFSNTLTEGLNTNVLMYEYFYNGGGVAVGDLNGDGMQDIYFTGNMTDNKLYLNKDKLQFEDVTDAAGVQGRPGPWKTGVTMVDINADGRLDLFVCYSGKINGAKRIPQLFINQGNDAGGIPHFKDEAPAFGITDSLFCTQGFFFDYDKDGDLDLLLLNHNPKRLSNLDEPAIHSLLDQQDKQAGTRLLVNNNNFFTDVTQKAGLVNSSLNYNLGAGIADVNNDGWPDIYLSNDYLVPDYLYINNKDGSFTNQLQKELGHTSQFSMGNDIADINNDGLPDIFTLDMLPEDNHRQKMLSAPDNYEQFDINIHAGFYYQYMRNMLHLNNGDGSFSEIGQLAGISNTDWSWAPLFADYDNDGWKDLYITNGYVRDYTNLDFLKYMSDFLRNRQTMRTDLLDLVQKIPSSGVKNYLFKNNGNSTFSNMGAAWGVTQVSNSNGAVYADLDNDGDLDMVVNNINQPAFIYRNNAEQQNKNHYIAIALKGAGRNTEGIGAKIYVYAKGKQQYAEQMPAKGFQSSVSPILHFGLGLDDSIDSLRIIWMSGKQQTIQQIKANQTLTLQEQNALAVYTPPVMPAPAFKEINSGIAYQPAANTLNDFKRQPLLVNPFSFSGPCLAKGDLNGDGLEDVFTGGGSGKAGALFIQQKNGSFVQKKSPALEADKMYEDADGLFFDANGDGFTDLYVASGGYHQYMPDDPLLQDRLYLNDGRGNLVKNADALPPMRVSKGCVRTADINGDGRPDLFVGGRVVPGRYPETPQSFILLNDGRGHFTDKTADIAPGLQKAGMVTDAAWIDLNNDKKTDLIIVGEWMPVSIYLNVNGKLENKTGDYFDKNYTGWWNKLQTGDFNKDGKPDLIIGNFGLNTQCRVSDQQPAELYYKDFDDNGSLDPIFCFYIQGKSYPYVTRDELLDQMSIMRTRFTDYKSYADAGLTDIFTEEELKGARHLQSNYLETAFFEMGADGKFHVQPLPLQAQYAPVYCITTLDYNNDGNEDLLLCGNINHARLRFGKADANYGTLLQGDGKGHFTSISQQQSGFHLTGDTRSVLNINNTLFFGINQQKIKSYTLKQAGTNRF